MDVVVVESPNKVKSINKYLGKNYKVLASFGHVRDLPAKDGSVKPDDDFAMSWAIDTASAKRLNDIAKTVKEADGLILATDPDREGEAIAWHVLEVRKLNGKWSALRLPKIGWVKFRDTRPCAARSGTSPSLSMRSAGTSPSPVRLSRPSRPISVRASASIAVWRTR